MSERKISGGVFLTFEGPDCSGKTTQIALLEQWLRQKGYAVLCTREPGGTPMAEKIRGMLLEHGTENVASTTELLLFAASRAQHVSQKILPHLEQGGVVLCDRFYDSTTAYQGYARGMERRFIRSLNEFCTCGRAPDVTFLLDLPIQESRRRLALRLQGERPDRLEDEALAFHEKVRQGFLEIARQEEGRFRVLDAMQTIEEIATRIRQEMEHVLARV